LGKTLPNGPKSCRINLDSFIAGKKGKKESNAPGNSFPSINKFPKTCQLDHVTLALKFHHVTHRLQGLVSLTTLLLAENNLTGSIPTWIGNLSSLTSLILDKNSLEGNIPESLGNLKMLKILEGTGGAEAPTENQLIIKQGKSNKITRV
jgi:Leucine-rich repeat (LRR) protein